MNRYCDLCQQGPITSESQWQQHISGKKHKKNEWKRGSGMQCDFPDDKRTAYFVPNMDEVETIEVKLTIDDDLEDLVKYEPSYPSQQQYYHGPGEFDFPQLGATAASAQCPPPESFPTLSSVSQVSSKMSSLGLGRGVGRGVASTNSAASGPARSWSNITKTSAPALAPVQQPLPQSVLLSERRQLTQSERSGNVKVIQQNTAPVVSTAGNRPIAKSAKHEMAKRIYRAYKDKKKTASQAFQEIATNLQWIIDIEECTPSSQSFCNYATRWKVNGFVCEAGEGTKKKQAKENASRKALAKFANVIENPEKHSVEDEQEEGSTTTKAIFNPCNEYKLITRKKIETLVRSVAKINLGDPSKFAAFIITRQLDQPAAEGEVVAMGTGRQITKFSTSQIKDACGYRLHDMQAPVMAKRALQAYFYGQLAQAIQPNGVNSRKYGENIFEFNGSSGRYRLKHGVRIHLFLSHTPSGDAISFLRDNWTEPEILSDRELNRDLRGELVPVVEDTEKGYGRLRVIEDPIRDGTRYLSGNTSNEISEKVEIMSLSDKIMKWNHVGVQGALLTHLIEPVFLHSIQMGYNYSHGHVARALLTRVPLSIFPSLPNGYNNAADPYIGRTTKVIQMHNRPEGGVAWDWYAGASTVEVIDCNEGLVDIRNPVHDADCSRISNVTMLLRLRARCTSVFATGDTITSALTKRLRQMIKGDFDQYSYHNLKQMAKEYQDAKSKLYSSLSSKLMGTWKPKKILQDFCLDDYAE